MKRQRALRGEEERGGGGGGGGGREVEVEVEVDGEEIKGGLCAVRRLTKQSANTLLATTCGVA